MRAQTIAIGLAVVAFIVALILNILHIEPALVMDFALAGLAFGFAGLLPL